MNDEQLDELYVRHIERVGLTPQQRSQWADTMSLMAWTAPGFRHLFYKLLADDGEGIAAVPVSNVPVAATDQKRIMINPEKFFQYGLKERVFIMAHEVLHNVYNDVSLLHNCKKSGTVPMTDGTTMPFSNSVMQRAMDFRINALLKDSNIGTCPKDAHIDPAMATGTDSVYDVYKKVYQDDDANGRGHGDGAGDGFDVIISPGSSVGQSPSQTMSQRSAQQWAVELAAAQSLEQQRSQGKMSGALSRFFKDLLEPEVPWTEHIRSIFNRRVGSGSYDWKRPDRRFITRDIFMPSKSGFGAGTICVWGDTSGSIGAAELEKYLGELAGILEDVRPKRVIVYWCDSAIHQTDEITDISDLHRIKARGVGGGGGTSVDPVLEAISKLYEEPDAFVGFTDGYVSFPDRAPTYPVIWASVTDCQYPFGEVVRINPKKH